MVFVGERLTKILAEKGELEAQMEINIAPKVTDIKVEEINIGGDKKKSAIISFDFTAAYGKNAGKIQILGELFFAGAEDEMKKLEDAWSKDKKLTDEKLRLGIMNKILEVGYMKAINVSEGLKLPPPLQMPRFVAKK